MKVANGQKTRRPRPPQNAAPEREPIRYRLPKFDEEPEQAVQEATDYGPLVTACGHAALSLFATQAVASMLIANFVGATIEIHFIYWILPYLSVSVTEQNDLPDITSYSTAAAVLVVCVGVIQSLARHRENPLRIYGWSTGLAMAALLLGLQYLRHRANPPLVDVWVLVQAAAALVATTVVFMGFKPMSIEAELAASSGASQRPRQSAPPKPVRKTNSINLPSKNPVRTPE